VCAERGFEIDIQSPKEEKLALFTHGERNYDLIVLFPPKSKGYGPSLTPILLVEHMNKDGNILLLTSPSGTPEQARELARELDIDIPPRNYKAVDHFNHEASSEHDLILVPRPDVSTSQRNFFSAAEPEYIAFRGAGHTLGNRPLLFPILKGSRTAYVYDTKEDFGYAEDPWTAGSQVNYVSALQARNNARIVVVGSTDIFSDEFFDMKAMRKGEKTKVKTANRAFAKELTRWVFQETGVLKVVNVQHYLANETDAQVNPSLYRVKNDVTFDIEISEYNGERWTPFIAPPTDSLQLEFTMLDPYYRVPLTPKTFTPSSTVYTTSFTVPDQHGVFAFKVNYKRPFLTYLEEKHSVTIRHFAHDEYTRSWDISGAWVWIAGIAVTVVSWVAFCALWLWSAPVPATKKGKKTQ